MKSQKRTVPQSVFDSFSKMAKKVAQQSSRDLDQTPRHMLDKANPNYRDLFGYPESEFLAKQY